MAKLYIETGDNNTILRTVSSEVSLSEIKQHRALAQNMVKYIKNLDNGAVGLAAPQIGLNKRLIAVSLLRDYEDESYRTIAMFNPTILEHSIDTCVAEEGCLSVPGEKGDVKRWRAIRLTFQDTEGKNQILQLENLAARIVQHEIDHLDGVLFTDKLEDNEKELIPELLLKK